MQHTENFERSERDVMREQYVKLYELESKLDQMRSEYLQKPFYERSKIWWTSLFNIVKIRLFGSAEDNHILDNCQKAVQYSREGKLP
jgi:hypothetical protein